MKKIIFIALAMLCTAGAMAQTAAEKRKIQEAQRLAQVAELVRSDKFIFIAERANTTMPGQPYKALDPGYNMKMIGDSINCYLPFYGRGYSASSIMTGESPLVFTAHDIKKTVEEKKRGKNLVTVIRMEVRPNNRATSTSVEMEIMPNGNTTLALSSFETARMIFNGYIDPYNEKDKR